MNIAFVTSSRIWSGVKTWMLEFGTALQRRGHIIHAMAQDDRFLTECERAGLRPHRVRFRADYDPRTILEFRQRFRNLDIDVTCMNVQKELRTAGVAAAWRGIPVVHRVGLVRDLTGKFDERMTHHLLVNGILVTSRWMRSGLLAEHGYIRPEKVSIVFNGKMSGIAAPRKQKGDPVRFVAAYRLAPDKLHLDLLNAFRTVRESGLNDFTCDIYGDGPMEPALAAAIRDLGLANHVRLMGFIPDVAGVLHNYDFGVLTSRIEGLSNTILEYLAAGMPAISTNQGALPELLTEGVNGFLYTPGDVDRLAAHLKTAIQLPEAEYLKMSATAQEGVRTRFSQEHLAGQLELYFRHMADAAERGRGEQSPDAA